MKKLAAGGVLAGFLLSGCASVPFEPVKFTPVEALAPETVRRNFNSRLADPFEVTESVVFKYHRRTVTAIGYTRADGASGSFASAGFTPLGLKIFEITNTGGVTEASFSVPLEAEKTMNRETTTKAMAEDFRRVYFDRIPAGDAGAIKKRDRIYFRQPAGSGILEFVFGGPDQALVEKNYSENGRAQWRVRYFSYTEKNGRIYPDRIFYQNLMGKYELTLRLKEITA